MKANVVHGDFNPCGGAERLSLVTIQSISEMGINFDVTTLQSPDISKLENSFGKNLVSVLNKADKINVISILKELWQHQHQFLGEHEDNYNYDITINTNGDAAPYYHSSFSKNNAITYCHYPSTQYHIEIENREYLRTDLGMTEWANISSKGESHKGYEDKNSNNNNGNSNNNKPKETELQFRKRKYYFEIIKYGYQNLMNNSLVVTNSAFSCRAIANTFKLDDIRILSPPIDIETFHNIALMSNGNNKNKDTILVISRIAPHKKIENAIKLAKILKDNNVGRGMKIVGNLYHYFLDYYSGLQQMIEKLDLTEYITFEINASLGKLLSIIRNSSIYFHPMVGEHFGMSIIEALAAGLVTVVPKEGGASEFVPQRYQYDTIKRAADIITYTLNHPPKEDRISVKGLANFSNSQYIAGFQNIVNELINHK
jgi:glycosyltransferase involved in cell wall biosynthesis